MSKKFRRLATLALVTIIKLKDQVTGHAYMRGDVDQGIGMRAIRVV